MLVAARDASYGHANRCARVAVRDVQRAANRAKRAAPLSEAAVAVVAGERMDWDARELAEQLGVREIITSDD